MTTADMKPPPSPAPRPPSPAPRPPTPRQALTEFASNEPLAIQSGIINSPQRIGIYGTGGSGKTSLAASLAQVGRTPIFLDTEMGTCEQRVDRIQIDSWEKLRQALKHEQIMAYKAVVIDSLTRAEELAVKWTLANVRTEKNILSTSIEGYSYGKGYVHAYETFMPLLSDLEWLQNKGLDIVLICHDCTATRPNPEGEDYPRYEPRLQSPNSGKNSIRHAFKEWLGHLLFIGYDVNIADGKGQGIGTRTIYPQERATFWAKSRTLSEPIAYEKGSVETWTQLFGDMK